MSGQPGTRRRVTPEAAPEGAAPDRRPAKKEERSMRTKPVVRVYRGAKIRCELCRQRNVARRVIYRGVDTLACRPCTAWMLKPVSR